MATNEQQVRVDPEHLHQIRATLGVLSETPGGTINTKRVLVYTVRASEVGAHEYEALSRGFLIDPRGGGGVGDPAVLALLQSHAEDGNPPVVVAYWEKDAGGRPVAVTLVDYAQKIHANNIAPGAGIWVAKCRRWRWFAT